MDLVDYSEERYEEIRAEFQDFAAKLDVRDVNFIPISALAGDNVVERLDNTPWYQGPTLLRFLEDLYIASDINLHEFRMPVQYVIRPHTDEHHDFRGFAGQIAGGTIRKGDKVKVLPSGHESVVKEINTLDGAIDEAFSPMSVSLLLEDNIDISRGNMIVGASNPPHVGNDIAANICWMAEQPLQLGRKYIIKHTTNSVRGVIKQLHHRVDIQTQENDTSAETLKLNDIGLIQLRTAHPHPKHTQSESVV